MYIVNNMPKQSWYIIGICTKDLIDSVYNIIIKLFFYFNLRDFRKNIVRNTFT